MHVEQWDSPDPVYVADGKSDFDGWEIFAVVHWKPGVKQVHMRSAPAYSAYPAQFRIVYSNAEFVPVRKAGKDAPGVGADASVEGLLRAWKETAKKMAESPSTTILRECIDQLEYTLQEGKEQG